MVVIKLIALALLALGIWAAPGLNPTSSRMTSLGTVAFWVGVAAVLLFAGGSSIPRWLDKTRSIVALCVALVIPVSLVAFMVVALSEKSSRERGSENLVVEMTSPGGVKKLADFFFQPDRVAPGLHLEPSQVERIEQYVLSLPPEQLMKHHLAENLLMGLFADTSPVVASGTFHTPALDAMYRLYPKLKERSGFSPADAPFYLQQRDRLASRLAELGREKWLEELRQEHPAFQELSRGESFSAERFHALFPTPLAPRERVVSRSLGSLPLHVLVTLNLGYFPAPSGPKQAPDPIRERYRLDALNATREALKQMKSRGVDFTEEERQAPGLKAFLDTVRAATPPARD
ncbi:hypothetical protein NR798_27885 [Archangium gephyra]|uniref:hypothetical protein n=1 Tax=Archangium gephyra TaxID=48 RepID=UPI0035D51D60